MAIAPIELRPIKGVYGDINEELTPDGYVPFSQNFLFGRGEARTRFGAVTVSAPDHGFIGSPVFAAEIESPELTVWITNDAGGTRRLWKSLPAIQITGAGLNQGIHYNCDVINGDVIFGNNTGGLVRWRTSGNTYDLIPAVSYRFVTGHQSRAVAAYDVTSPGARIPRRIAWSKVGDVTSWAPPYGGYTDLTDIPDEITGLGNINDVLVILRSSGLHLGFKTGTNPPFRFDHWSRKGFGCPYPTTVAFFKNKVFYVGDTDVYQFDLSEVQSVGYGIRKELLYLMRSGISYRGFISRRIRAYSGTANSGEPIEREYYNLVPTSGIAPHFMLDLEEMVWSRMVYGYPLTGGGIFRSTNRLWYTPVLFSGETMLTLDNATPLEYPAVLRTKSLSVGPQTTEARVPRVLLKYRDTEDPADVKVVLRSETLDGAMESIENMSLGGGGTNRWKRRFANVEAVGQDFQVELEVQPGSSLALSSIALPVIPEGEILYGSE